MLTAFSVLPLRFHLTAGEAIHFPVGKPANVLRGALGATLKRVGGEHTYARIFEPVSTDGPSGLVNAPRPFVFRARDLDGRTVEPGESFHFDVNLFDVRGETVDCFVRVMAELARNGLGPTRGRAALDRVDRPEPLSLSLDAPPGPIGRIRVEFLTPTELKSEGGIITRPEFGILFGRIRDRISTLGALYGSGPLPIDFVAMGERADRVRMTRCDIEQVAVARTSAQTGQRHSLGGFVGVAEYEGELAEFAPYLEAAGWTGVGRQTVWGKGECAISRGDLY